MTIKEEKDTSGQKKQSMNFSEFFSLFTLGCNKQNSKFLGEVTRLLLKYGMKELMKL